MFSVVFSFFLPNSIWFLFSGAGPDPSKVRGDGRRGHGTTLRWSSSNRCFWGAIPGWPGCSRIQKNLWKHLVKPPTFGKTSHAPPFEKAAEAERNEIEEMERPKKEEGRNESRACQRTRNWWHSWLCTCLAFMAIICICYAWRSLTDLTTCDFRLPCPPWDRTALQHFGSEMHKRPLEERSENHVRRVGQTRRCSYIFNTKM